MLARGWHATVALLAIGAIVLQVAIAIRLSGTPHDVSTGLLRGSSLAGRIIRVFSFFTISSTLLSGIVSAQLAVRPDRDGTAWRTLRLAALAGITVSGACYASLLPAIHEPDGTAEITANTIVHYVVPIMTVAGWLLFGPRPRVGLRRVWWSLLFPVLWLACTLVCGAIWNWYPYPFFDVTANGYLSVAVNALLLTVLLEVVAAAFAMADVLLPAAPRPPAKLTKARSRRPRRVIRP